MKLAQIFSFKKNARLERDLLLKVYEAALAEYRYNVQLGWDRTKFYLTLSVTAIAAGIALFHFAEGSRTISIFLSLYFFMLFFLSALGMSAIKTGKRYTREAIYTKTLVERELGLLHPLADGLDQRMHLAIAVTPGMLDHNKVLTGHNARVAKKVDVQSILGGLNRAFIIIMIIELAGVVVPWIDIVTSIKEAPKQVETKPQTAPKAPISVPLGQAQPQG